MNKSFKYIINLLVLLFITSCNKDEIGPQYSTDNDKADGAPGFWVVNEGNWNWGNASISFYDTQRQIMSNLVYKSKQDKPMGDVLQSIYFKDDYRFLVLNNSHQVKLCSEEMVELKEFHGFNSPRYMEHLSGDEYLVTSIDGNQIYKLNIETKEVTTFLSVTDWTEKILKYEDAFIVEHKSFSDVNPADQQLLKVDFNGNLVKTLDIEDPHSDLTNMGSNKFCFISQLEDGTSKLWICDTDFNIQTFNIPEKVSQLSYSSNTIYLAGEHLWSFKTASSTFTNLRSLKGKTIYGLSSSDDGYVYLCDAKDYVSSGDFLIYSTLTQSMIDSVKTSIIPSEIYFEK